MEHARTILVPYDFSDPSQSALDKAVELAEELEAKLVLLYAYQVPVTGFPNETVLANADVAGRIIDAAQKALDDVLARYDGRKVEIVPMLRQGDPREVILGVVEDLPAEMVVMGTHGRRGIARALMGSVTEMVIRTCPAPVLTVSGGATRAPQK